MESNHTCICGMYASTLFCTCQPPSKLYLCNHCIPSHTLKSGSHCLFPVSVHDIRDPDLQNRRRIWVLKITEQLEEFKSEVGRQREGLELAVRETYEERTRTLWEHCQRVQWDISQVYQELLEVVEKTKGEILEVENRMSVEISKEAMVMIQLTCHPEKCSTPLFGLPSEIQNLLDGHPPTTLQSLLSKWTCTSHLCPACSSKLSQLGVSCKPQSSLLELIQQRGGGQYWRCSHCDHRLNFEIDEKCRHCGRFKASPASRSSFRLEASPTDQWRCLCGHPSNTSSNCDMCFAPRSQIRSSSAILANPEKSPSAASTRLSQRVNQPSRTWTCPCGADNVIQAKECFACSSPKRNP